MDTPKLGRGKYIRRSSVRKTPTFKQKRFAQKYVLHNGNGVQAALESYDTKNYNSAKRVATDNVHNPIVQEEIQKELIKAGLTIDYLNHKSKIVVDEIEHGNVKTLGVGTNHLQFLYKLYNVLPANKSVKMNLNINQELTAINVDVATKNLKELHNTTQSLLEDLKS